MHRARWTVGEASARIPRWLPPTGWAALILVATSWPRLELSGVPEGSDKLGHFLMYAVLGLLTLRATRHPSRWAVATVAACGLLVFAAADEWHQRWIPGRSASFDDWIADSVGAVCGLLVYRLTYQSALRRRESLS